MKLRYQISESDEQREAFYERLRGKKDRYIKKEESVYKHFVAKEDLYGRHIGIFNPFDLEYLKKNKFNEARVWLKQCDYGLFRIRLAELDLSYEDTNCFTASGYYPTSTIVQVTPNSTPKKMLKRLGYEDFNDLTVNHGQGQKKRLVATNLYSFSKQEFESIAEAARKLALNNSSVRSAIRDGRQFGGYSFEVKETA